MVVAQVNSSDTAMTLEEVQSLLLTQEVRIQRAIPPDIVSAHNVSKQSTKYDSGQRYNSGRFSNHNRTLHITGNSKHEGPSPTEGVAEAMDEIQVPLIVKFFLSNL